MRPVSTAISRRGVIKLMAGTGAALGLALGVRSDEGVNASGFSPNAYLEISVEKGVVFWTKKAEMGQHIHTALAMMVADELGADLDTLTVEQTDTHPKFGFVGTGGSYAIPGHWRLLMPMMAAAREMLLLAAAKAWNVPISELVAEGGRIEHKNSDRSALLEAFADQASSFPVPEKPALKKAADYRYVGKGQGRVDAAVVLNGSAIYGIDKRLPGMRFAVIDKSPVVGAELTSYDADASKRVAGVETVLAFENMIAVVASNSWSAMEGRKALGTEWHSHSNEKESHQGLMQKLHGLVGERQHLVLEEGSRSSAGTKQLDLTYEMPMAQHAALEPVNATAHFSNRNMEIWAPCQMATLAQQDVAKALGLPKEKVQVHTTLLGGSFGRKLERGYVIEAARLAHQLPYPIQLIYSREDDMRHGGVRPPSVHEVRFDISEDNQIAGMELAVATPSVFYQQDPEQLKTKGYDWTIPPGMIDTPYSPPYLKVSQTELHSKAVTFNWWRGTQRNNNALAVECGIDEAATAVGLDPLELRLSWITSDRQSESFPGDPDHISASRARRLLHTLADVSDYRRDRPVGRAVGIALHVYSTCMTYAAHAVEVSVKDGALTIHKVTAVVDCGIAVSPESVKAQMEGGVIFGLTSALWGDLSVEQGAITTLNFDDCRLMRLDEAPEINVHIVESEDGPGGMGEPPLPSVTPALLNAIARAGGPRVRRLPIADQINV